MKDNKIFRLTVSAMLAAMVCALTFLRFPLLGSKVHLANAMCLLCGMILGPVGGGIAAGFGSALYDLLWGGYDIIEALITFASKFLMAMICGFIFARKRTGGENKLRAIAASVIGALSYVALYMLKTYIKQYFVLGNGIEATIATMLSKLPASMINAAFAMVAAPVIWFAVRPVLKNQGFFTKLDEA